MKYRKQVALLLTAVLMVYCQPWMTLTGQIVITRSLGDHLMKDFILGDPYVSHQKLTDKDTFLIVACDGVICLAPLLNNI